VPQVGPLYPLWQLQLKFPTEGMQTPPLAQEEEVQKLIADSQAVPL